MEDLNKKFEEEWKSAFEGAEEEPNGAIWQNIENNLANKDIQHYKRRFFYLQIAAAVLLLLFLPLSGYFVYHFSNEGLAVHTSQNENRQDNLTNSTELSVKKDNGNKDAETIPGREENLLAKSKKNVSQENDIVSDYPLNSKKQDSENSIVLDKGEDNPLHGKNEEERKSFFTERKHTPSVAVREKERIISDFEKEKNNIKVRRGSEELINVEGNELSKENIAIAFDENKDQLKEENTMHSSNSDNTLMPNKNNVFSLIAIEAKGPVIKETRLKPMYIYLWKNEGLFVQNDNHKEKRKINRWYAGVDFVPNYTNQNFKSNNSEPPLISSPAFADSKQNEFLSSVARTTLDQSAKDLESYSTPSFSYSSGFNGAYRLNSRLSVEMGIKYVYSEAKVSTNYIINDLASVNQYPAFNMVLKETSLEEAANRAMLEANSPGVAYNNVSKISASNLSGSFLNERLDFNSINIYTQYVGVPLTLNYKLIDKRIDVSLGGGVSSDFFIKYGSKESTTAELSKETITRSEESVFRPVTFSFLIAPEFEYGFSSRTSIYLRPVYKGALQSFTNTETISNRPNSMGVGFGLKYNFK